MTTPSFSVIWKPLEFIADMLIWRGILENREFGNKDVEDLVRLWAKAVAWEDVEHGSEQLFCSCP